ncbi:MAG: sigma-70 family RNA polymerase sigma factor [Gemmatimonadaceae bacterium]|nr:sigma-70 family RNA polymerase sigma factor [Gemmatimonadaceae bacterium]
MTTSRDESRGAADGFTLLFREEYPRLYGYVQRLCGEPDLAADVVQDAFVRLHARGERPGSTRAWLITVATNLLRNARTTHTRRRALLHRIVPGAGEGGASVVTDRDNPVRAMEASDERARVRAAIATLSRRDQELLSLLAGGYRYREMAEALQLNPASIGTLLARAKLSFRAAYGGHDDAP